MFCSALLFSGSMLMTTEAGLSVTLVGGERAEGREDLWDGIT